jgi:glycosyltransferase involved in cell wall biosynthesis
MRQLLDFFHRHSIPILFWLRNHAYHDPSLFHGLADILVPSHYTAKLYKGRLNLRCTPLPPPLDHSRLLCPTRTPRFLTFVNPQPRKGLPLFLALAQKLAATRPDIPILVVGGMATRSSLSPAGLPIVDLDPPSPPPTGTKAVGPRTNSCYLHFMPTTSDPRLFYAQTKVLLVPSLADEPFGRVVAEAHVNAIPVISSNRGGLPESVADAGLLIPIAPHHTPTSPHPYTEADLSSWLQAITTLWHSPHEYTRLSQIALSLSLTRSPTALAAQYHQHLLSFLRHRF